MTEILDIDVLRRTCVAEPGVTFVDLAEATLEHGLLPLIVPELKTITIGGAVSGCSIESMSFEHGGFHDTCLEYEVITATGDVRVCTSDNDDKLLLPKYCKSLVSIVSSHLQNPSQPPPKLVTR